MVKKADQRTYFDRTIAFYEERIEESICKKEFDLARSWYSEMQGACYLADGLGLLSDTSATNSRNKAWFRRIQDAQYGKAGGDLIESKHKNPRMAAGTTMRGRSCQGKKMRTPVL